MKRIILLFLYLAKFQNAFCLGIIQNNNLLSSKKWGEFLEAASPWRYGGSFGMNFIRDGYTAYFAPSVSYRAGGSVFLGVSSGLSFASQKVEAFNLSTQTYEKLKLQSLYFDNSIFMRWFCWGLKFIQIEPGIVSFQNIERYYWNTSINNFTIEKKWKNVPYIQAGAGFIIPFAENKFIIIRTMYDVLQNKESPYYGLPIIRGGINIGI